MSGMMVPLNFIEVAMNLEHLKEKLNQILKTYDLNVYSIRTKREFGERIVEILIDTETMDINVLEKIHMTFVESLTDDELDPNYYLELSSLGAERPLKTLDEVIKAIGKYIYFEAPNMKSYGTLNAIENDIMKIEINDKGRLKIVDVKFETVKNMRTAIKF
jgi:ribosome maturation factor RimP